MENGTGVIIDFIQIQKQKFDTFVSQIMAEPIQFFDFDSVSDFYKAEWLNAFPQGTTWAVSGLDDGADEFCIQIQFKELVLNIDIQLDTISLKYNQKKVVIAK